MKILVKIHMKAESPGIKIAIKLNVSEYPVILREKCDSSLVSFRKKILKSIVL